MQEIEILQQVKSDNIVRVHEVMESSNNYYMILELCDCDLEKYMRLHPLIPEPQAVQMLRQLVNGFVALIREGIIHRYGPPHAVTSSPPTSSSRAASSSWRTSASRRRTFRGR